jgi:UTP--glucose-1-phosphate uridylyltransferase
MQAFVEYGVRHPVLGKDFAQWLDNAVGNKK